MTEERTEADQLAATGPWDAWVAAEIANMPAKQRTEFAYSLGFEIARKHYMADIRRLQASLKDAQRWLKRAMTLAEGDEKLYKQFKDAVIRAKDSHKKEIKGNAN